MSLGVMRPAACLDSFATMDSAIYHDDPLPITAVDLLNDFQALETSPDLSIEDYFSADFDYSAFARAPLSPVEGPSADSRFHLQTIETSSTASGPIETHTKFDLTYSTQTSPVTPSKIRTGLLTPLTSSLSFCTLLRSGPAHVL